jgi:RNA polymerase sigma-70 factor (ECF subfamily)
VRELSDNRLLELARKEPGAFAAFYARHGAPMLAYMARRVREPEVAADLTAEVFAAALEDAGRFDPARGSAAGWLYGIAHHKLADSIRSGQVEDRARRRLGVGALQVDDEDVERIHELAGLDVAAVNAALAQLPPAERAAIHARIVEERPYAEIAGDIETSALVVRKRVSRGLGRLRTILGDTR